MTLITVLAIALLGAAAPRAAPAVEKNVVYGMYSGLALLLDVHHPERRNGLGVILVPGSGWEAPLGFDATGLKEGKAGRPLSSLPALLQAGYTVFAINHRASPRFQHPAALEDVQRAVRFVRHRAPQYGIDPARLGAVGGSSGAHLVALTAALAAPGRADDADPVNREPATLQCLVIRAAPTNLAALVRLRPTSKAAAYIGRPVTDDKSYAAASPVAHLTPAMPPVLLVHGDADETIPYEQSVAMEAALRAAKVPSKLIRLPRGNHGLTVAATGKPAAGWPDHQAEMVRWLDQHLPARPGGPPARAP